MGESHPSVCHFVFCLFKYVVGCAVQNDKSAVNGKLGGGMWKEVNMTYHKPQFSTSFNKGVHKMIILSSILWISCTFLAIHMYITYSLPINNLQAYVLEQTNLLTVFKSNNLLPSVLTVKNPLHFLIVSTLHTNFFLRKFSFSFLPNMYQSFPPLTLSIALSLSPTQFILTVATVIQ
jgi:hypothetical protein